MDIKRYLEVQLNTLEEEQTKLTGRLEELSRQVNLYEQLIATYEYVEEEVRKIEEAPIPVATPAASVSPVEKGDAVEEREEDVAEGDMTTEVFDKIVEKYKEKEEHKTYRTRGTKYTTKILAVIDGYGEPMGVTEVAAFMGKTPGQIYNSMKIMTRDRLLVKSGLKYDIRKKEVKAHVQG